MHTDSDRRPRLRDQFRDAIRVRHYSPRTEKTYWYWIRYFIRFPRLRHPAEMSEPEVSGLFFDLARHELGAMGKAGKVPPGCAVPWDIPDNLSVSGSQTLRFPFATTLEIPKPVMQPTRPPMPELNLLGNDAIPPPGLRHGHRLTFRILLRQRSHVRFQLLPACRPALMGDGGAELAAPGAGGEVVAGLLGEDFLGTAVDDQLAVEGAPEHDEGDVGVGGDVVAFAAVVVGEEDEAALFDAFEQHDAAGGAAVGGDGGQGHGVGQGQLGVDGVVDPAAGLFHRVRQQVRFGEAGGVVFLAYVFHGVLCSASWSCVLYGKRGVGALRWAGVVGFRVAQPDLREGR